ncbi:peptidyl-prolyl cis-trans isomerase, partial [bacterium]|nr:peptidyl-prolyl cis-trans isomerase [bacterium]
ESFSTHEGASFDNYLKNSGMTEKKWKEKLKQYLIQKKLVNEEVNSKILTTKREIKSYYQENIQEFTTDSAIKVRNITLSTEEEAKAIQSKLLRGANFNNLVREHSISPDKVLDGDLGYIKRGDLPAEMESVIFSKEYPVFTPRVTEVVQSQDGFHVFNLEKIQGSKKMNLMSSEPRIKNILVEKKWDEYYNRWLNKLKKNATISIDQALLSREEGF